jgi:hypothetical protein
MGRQKKYKHLPSELKVLLPKTWETDLKRALETTPPNFNYKLDSFIYLGHLICHLMFTKHNKEDSTIDGYVPVDKKLLQRRIRDYNKYLDYLGDNELIDQNRQYIPKVRSGSIRYSVKYKNQSFEVAPITDYNLIKGMLTFRKVGKKEELAEEIIPNTELWYLNKWFNENLTCDLDQANKILNEMKEKEDLNPITVKKKHYFKTQNGKKIKVKIKESANPSTQDRYQARFYTAKAIAEGIYYSNRTDRKTGRYHSPLTRLKRELRKTIRYEGKRLVSVDITNSQPFFLIAYLDPKVFRNLNMSQILINSKNTLKNKEPKPKNQPNLSEVPVYTTQTTTFSNEYNKEYNIIKDGKEDFTIMVVKRITELYQNPDVMQYIEWVTDGTYYDKLGGLLSKVIDTSEFPSIRDAGKSATFGILFGQTGKYTQNEKKIAFREEFPSVANITRLVKTDETKERSHSTLSCTLQTVEANIILKYCCGTIANERPDLPIFTIHDSIVTTEGNEEYVKSVMERTIQSLVGHVPKFKFENWW